MKIENKPNNIPDAIPAEKPVKKVRQIVIETDGDTISLIKSEAAGHIELVAILTQLAAYLSKSR